MIIAADYPFLDVFWTMLVFFMWIVWFFILFRVLMDIFRRNISGWAKAAWIIFVIVLPFLGVLVYLIAEGTNMSQRDMEQAQASKAQFDEYVKSVATPAGDAGGGAAAEIAKAKDLLDSGAISQAEFDAIKAKALAA